MDATDFYAIHEDMEQVKFQAKDQYFRDMQMTIRASIDTYQQEQGNK